MTLDPVLVVGLGVVGLLAVGLYGLLVVRNLIKMIVVLQILAKSAMLAFVAAGAATRQVALSQSLVVTIIVADTVVAVIAIALAVLVKRHFGTLDLRELTSLRG